MSEGHFLVGKMGRFKGALGLKYLLDHRTISPVMFTFFSFIMVYYNAHDLQ